MLLMVADLRGGALFFEWAGASARTPVGALGARQRMPVAEASRLSVPANAHWLLFAGLGSGHKLQIPGMAESPGLRRYPNNTLRADAGGGNTKVVTASVGEDRLRHFCPSYGVHPRRAEVS
jgi:hypothetical protein